MKSVRSVTVAALVLLPVLAGCGDDDTSTSTPTTEAEATTSLTITSPTDGAAIKGNVATLDLEGKGVTIVKADGDTSGKTGHYHVFVDRDPVPAGTVIPKEAGIIHTTDDPVVVPGLAVGDHRFVVVYGDGAHTRIGSTQAETTVKVEGPSIDARAPATLPVGQALAMDVAVNGLTLVKADGDTSGRTGHLHVFVDRAPTPAGQPIPVEAGIIHTAETAIEVPNLAPGEHTLWVVAGDGVHVPLDPQVMDKVTVVAT